MLAAYKSLIVILTFGLATFWLAEKTLPKLVTVKEFRRWRNTWLIVIFAAIFSPNIWFFYCIIILSLYFTIPSKPSIRIAYYLLLMCAVPVMSVIIPGFAGMKALFVISYPRALVITLFLGLYFTKSHKPRLFALSTDRYIVAFVMLLTILNFRDSTITNALRESFIIFIDVFVPYFIISRYLSTLKELNYALLALLISSIFLGIVGIFETAKHWLIFSELTNKLLSQGGYYDMRAGSLRAVASTSGPIVLAYMMVIGFGFLLYLKPLLRNQKIVYLAGLILISCLIATKARGPWVGFVLLILAYIWTSRTAIKGFIKIFLLTLGIFPLLSLTPFGQKFLDLLPFIGTTRSDTVDYRQRLIEHAWIVFQRQPWFGSTMYLDTPEMESMRQGQGIIDIVNSYIQVALSSGIFGLLLFVAIFLSLVISCHKKIKQLPKEQVDLIRMGRVLFAILSATLLIIFTVSSVNYIPVLYWALAGITAAYIHLSNQMLKSVHIAVNKTNIMS